MRTSLSLALAAVLAGAAGCQTVFGLDDPIADPIDPDERCFGSEVEVCLPSPPYDAGEKTLMGTIDTSSSSLCEPSIAPYCVIWAHTLTVKTVEVTGGRPIVLVGWDSIIVEGGLDAASHAGKPGPGAMTSCSTFPSNPTNSRGGGAGGTLGGLGGPGGSSKSDTVSSAGGVPVPVAELSGLRAGCRGQDGGGASTHGGTGGLGGGAVYLIAGHTLEVKSGAKVNASGTAGNGATCNGAGCSASPGTGETAGGGGGGSGGMLLLEARQISSAGIIFADGGGGGEGASSSNSGLAGSDPDGTKRAPGGTGGASNGGDGGSGSHGSDPNGGPPGAASSSQAIPGGGGGGGGAGLIRVYGAGSISGGAVSPEPDVR